MATFIVKIDTENDAFQPHPHPELARLLRLIADRLDTVNDKGNYTDAHGGWVGHYQTVHDVNGNDVGRYALKPKE